MNEQEKQQLQEVYDFIQLLKRYGSLPYDFEQAIKRRLDTYYELPAGLENAPLTKVGAPSGGTTIDSEARTAINSIITRLEDLGLINPK